MKDIDREDIQIIAQHSNWSERSIQKILNTQVYHDKTSWQQFLRLFFMSLGVGFTTAGIIFFFAYNWASMHKFFKLGLIEGGILLLTLVLVVAKIPLDIKKIILTGVSVLVGVLFAVFGQIYQTGANAYDFFLGWTMAIVIWVVISNFAPLWLVFITLINTTLILYAEQVAQDWSEIFVFALLFCINALFLIAFLLVKKINEHISVPSWFTNVLALAVVFFSTVGIATGIFERNLEAFWVLLLLATGLYGIGVRYGLKEKSVFYLSIIAFSCIIICCALLIEITSSEGMFFFLSLFVIASVSVVIKTLTDLKKKWKN
ncbi:DUF2157 domain-containing protein [Tenacibaculum aiptasiae]|uniref:DUF2157 domain-containing protein n=1 Tax=Tenacibaculum aiptasiae TaxID=426481 RepID=UPI00232E199F|nr:DUF2157 domain-containing protein [Tenacibaculum aiptasiae]